MKTNSRGFFPVVALLTATLGLVACETDLSYLGAPTDPGSPAANPPATLDLIASSTQLSSAANVSSAGVTLSALVKDSGNRVVSGAAVVFSVDNGASIITTQGTTDASGIAQAVVTTGNDPTNRALLVTAVAGSATDTLNVSVVGTTIAITGATTAQFGQPTTYVVSLLDSAGVGIANKTVTVSSAKAHTLSSTTLTTNGSGQVSFTYTVSNASSSPDTLTATALGISDTHEVVTSASDSFAFSAPAANTDVALGASQAVTLRWTKNGAGVPNKTITFASTRGTVSPGTAVTNGSGEATVNVSSTSAGTATVQANSDTGQVTTLRLEFIATTPAKIDVQASPAVISTNATSDITATVRDAADNLVKNASVQFLLNDVTGGSISAAQATTNSQGVAKVIYSSSSTTSSTDGVTITARIANAQSIADNIRLTVGGRAARIVLGTGNEIFEPNQTTYDFPYSVIVTDNNGAAVVDTDVFLSIEPISYKKGAYGDNPATATTVEDNFQNVTKTCPNEDLDKNGVLDDSEDVNCNGVLDAGEDTNTNGVLDLGEDVNGNCELDPSNVAAVPLKVTTGSNGSIQFNVTYPQDRGNWLVVKLTARTTVSGSETRESVQFVLPISQADSENPPGNPSPYGVAASCTDPN